jgi:Cell division septal protein
LFALRSDRGRGSADGGVVLPRWLRKPARMLGRVRFDEIRPPRFAATMATAALFALTAVYGVVEGGHSEAVLTAVTSRVGFAINHVEIAGNNHTSEIDILQQIGLDGWTSMVGFDVRSARERIAELPWVESVAVQKVYPATLAVTIVEKKPFALWQQGSQLAVIEENGEVIAPFSGGRLAALPLVIGMGANEKGPKLVAQVQQVRGLRGRVKAYIRVADRRWDLRLDNGLTIKLPETDVEAALAEASRLDAEYQLFSRDITSIDLRIPDRMAVALGPDAMKAREEMLKEMKAERRRGARI